MKLQILIPQYKENDKIVKTLLDSISIQQNVDFSELSVIICNDGSNVFLSEDLLKRYPYQIEYHKEPHRGVSGTRNACLDYASADYVMFCDADDMFHNACGLWILFREFGEGFDSLVSAFVEETRMPGSGEVLYVNREKDSTFVHGKVHRRAYLLEKNIRWNEKLTIHEDSYFNCLCQKLSKNVKYCKTPFYLWRWRDDSVCRHDEKYILKTFQNLLDSNTELVNQFLNRGMRENAQFYCVSMIYDSYFTMNKDEWISQENQEYRIKTEKRFQEYYLEFKDLFETVSDEIRRKIIIGIKNRMYGEGLLMEHITFDDWIKKVELL